jgi:hypothetical protein
MSLEYVSQKDSAAQSHIPRGGLGTNILDLPAEILLTIGAEIEDTYELSSVSKTCRTLNKLIEPHLYSKFTLDEPDYTKKGTKLQKFLFRLISKPELRKYVRVIITEGLQSIEELEDGESALEPGEEDEQQLLREIISELDVPDPDLWITGIEGAVGEVFLALLLTYTPNLEELHLVHMSYDMLVFDSVIQLALENIVDGKTKYLGNLKRLFIQHGDTEYGFSLAAYEQLVQLPSLREFNGYAVDSGFDEAVRINIITECLQVRALKLSTATNTSNYNKTLLHRKLDA